MTHESLASQAIMDMPYGRDFLTHVTTLDHYREGWSETIADWNPHAIWVNNPYRDIISRACKMFRQSLIPHLYC